MFSILLAALLQSAASSTPPPMPAGTMPPPLEPRPGPPPERQQWPIKEADFTARDFRFDSGETMSAVRIHYTTLGTPHRNAKGEIDNAVLIIHGTGGSGKQFLSPYFANQLYNPGQPLDITKYFLILPDNIGHGQSSKPSDGMRMKFPKYDYGDMVRLQHALVTQGLGLKQLRLVMGTSMGCMQSFMWGEMYPDMPKALMPLACEPIQIGGLNREWRQLMVSGIKADPAWNDGNYTTQPVQGIRTALSVEFLVTSAPLNAQATAPTRDEGDEVVKRRFDRGFGHLDANDMLYQFESSRDYNPWPNLEKIKADVMWVNSGDDFINPRDFPYPKEALARMPHAHYELIPASTLTHGHGTHTMAKFWKQYLVQVLDETGG